MLREIKVLETWIKAWESVHKKVEDLEALYTLATEEGHAEYLREAEAEALAVNQAVAGLELKKMLSGPDDHRNTLLTIHSGAGGTESNDWCSILYRMYTRWLDRTKFAWDVLDFQPGEEAGLKSATLEVNGEFAYGYLKSETGVHRLVRISPFDANKRRHTSFASVYALPVIEEVEDFAVPMEEIRIDTYRSGGAGGQHVNKTESAVRMTHIPTGIVAQCQNERSQIKNRSSVYQILCARVYQRRLEEEEARIQSTAVEKKKIEWGSQIRNYVLHPYNLVKDVRTGHETTTADGVLDGDLDPFINAYLLNLKHY
jgi:peptide chain release factor 2